MMAHLHSSSSTISGASLLQTEHILLKHAPELVPFIRLIRSRGGVKVHSSTENATSFSTYAVEIPKEACQLILGIAQRVERECKGHPASTRELTALWKEITERAS